MAARAERGELSGGGDRVALTESTESPALRGPAERVLGMPMPADMCQRLAIRDCRVRTAAAVVAAAVVAAPATHNSPPPAVVVAPGAAADPRRRALAEEEVAALQLEFSSPWRPGASPFPITELPRLPAAPVATARLAVRLRSVVPAAWALPRP